MYQIKTLTNVEASDENADICISHECVGYDGYLVLDYGAMSINILSNTVLTRICELNRTHILSLWGITSAGGRSIMGKVVEDLFWDDLKKANKMRAYQMEKTTNRKLVELVLDVQKCQHIEQVSLNELGSKVFHIDASTIARIRKNEALIDFAGPHCNVYQVTVSDNHSMTLNGLIQLFTASGHYNKIEEDKVGKISYYWVVPKERESVWKRKAPKTIKAAKRKETKEQKEIRKKVASYLEQYVDQYILVMDNVPIESTIFGEKQIHSEQDMHVTDDVTSTTLEQNIAKLKKYTVRELSDQCDALKLKRSRTKPALILQLLLYVDRISKKE